ncbi:uncharacterized protein PV09_07015 [Verruconis gallopava]|uniref:Uncharacterized protein n=1 Tax=Verruconis gallopava TaxID=253628 RepID=A0A0D1YL65_9PEZI|nr:uncharacterized protein PV09_07015 [Verruconis gallopava]KIW01537.1 hypothetical protein PV09_07015 [Verruconis gallopava]
MAAHDTLEDIQAKGLCDIRGEGAEGTWMVPPGKPPGTGQHSGHPTAGRRADDTHEQQEVRLATRALVYLSTIKDAGPRRQAAWETATGARRARGRTEQDVDEREIAGRRRLRRGGNVGSDRLAACRGAALRRAAPWATARESGAGTCALLRRDRRSGRRPAILGLSSASASPSPSPRPRQPVLPFALLRPTHG